jgi:hypothetical protein
MTVDGALAMSVETEPELALSPKRPPDEHR